MIALAPAAFRSVISSSSRGRVHKSPLVRPASTMTTGAVAAACGQALAEIVKSALDTDQPITAQRKEQG